jgi:hypothetical protein
MTQITYIEPFFHAVYREGVTAFEYPPAYHYTTEADGTVTITVYNPPDTIRQLTPDDTFVFEATPANPSGFAGHVLAVALTEEYAVIQARPPQSVEDIFEEFAIAASTDLLALGGQIVVREEFAHIPGLEVGRNPNNMFFIRFDDFTFAGISLSGQLSLIKPVVNHDIGWSARGGLDIRLLEMRAGTSLNVTGKFGVVLDQVFTLTEIEINIVGIKVSIPFGIRVTATGELEAQLKSTVDVHFGIKDNSPFFTRTVDYSFDFEFNARLEFCADVRMQLNLFKYFDVYGVYANIGLGVQTGTDILERCPTGDCFVVGSNIILRMGSERNFGLTLLFPRLNFGPIYFLPNMPVYFHYLSEGNWYRACPHRLSEADIYLPLLGEWEGTHLQPEPRGNHMLIFHDGFNYRALVNTYPLEESPLGRVGFYTTIYFDPVTMKFELRGTEVIYNPDGGRWAHAHWDGIKSGNTIAGSVYTNSHVVGTLNITQISGFTEGGEITGGPMPR